MKIVKMEILRLNLPMISSFETSFGRITAKETVITKLFSDDGLVGYGESASFHAPIYNHETVDSCFLVQEKFIAPKVVGKTFNNPEEFCSVYNNIIGNKIAQTGPECAFWHLVAQRNNKSLSELVGGVKTEVPVGESIGIKATIKETLEEINQRLEEGYVRIKVKIKPGWDVEVLRAIRKQFPNIDLTADGNSAYNLNDHLEILRSLDEFNLSMLEQPLAADDIIDHATLQKEIQTPICLDESIESAEDARKAIQLGACKIINIKPGRVGGLVESIKIHDLAAKHGIPVWCGGLLETGIGRAFNIALASKTNYQLPNDISPYQYFYKEDLVDPSYAVKPNGHIDVPKEPGLGFTINEDRIKKYTTQSSVISATT